jgi:hypothetical protein
MATKADFSEEEWETLQKGVTGGGLLVAVSDPGFFDSFKEAGAIAKHLAEAQQKSSSELIREIAHTRHTGFGLRASRAELEQEAVDTLGSAKSILEAKAPEELDAYKALVRDVAESVANAAKGVAPSESDTIEKLEAALA